MFLFFVYIICFFLLLSANYESVDADCMKSTLKFLVSYLKRLQQLTKFITLKFYNSYIICSMKTTIKKEWWISVGITYVHIK